jgi:hypothetical protein
MKFTIPLANLPARCVVCLHACPSCKTVPGESRLRMARLVLDLAQYKLEWFPDWRRFEPSKVD